MSEVPLTVLTLSLLLLHAEVRSITYKSFN